MRKINYPRGYHYRKSLLVILLVASIPGLITALGIYWFAVGAIESDLKVLHSKQLEQRIRSIDDTFIYIEQALSAWAQDPRLQGELLSADSLSTINDKEAGQALRLITGSHPMIIDSALYIRQDDEQMLLKADRRMRVDRRLALSYAAVMEQPSQGVWRTEPSILRGASQEGPTRSAAVIGAYYKLAAAQGGPQGVLSISLDPQQLLDLLLTMTPYHEGAIFLMNEHNHILISNHRMTTDEVFERMVRDDIVKLGEAQGSYVKKWEQTTYSVSYGTFDRLGRQWKYVAAAPMSAITSPVILASKIIFVISLLMLAAALILAWMASRRIYTPVEKLLALMPDQSGRRDRKLDEFELLESQWQLLSRQSSTLQMRLEKELPHVREGFLMQLIQGHLHAYSEKDLRERMKHYGWLVTDRQFMMLHVQLTGLGSGRFVSGDEGLVTFAAANILQELAAERFDQFNVLNFHDLSIGLLVIGALDEALKPQVRELAGQLGDSVHTLLKLHTTITLSRTSMLVSSLPDLFLDVTQATGYRLFSDENQLIDIEELQADGREQQAVYPFALDREIVQALRMGGIAEVEELLDQFLADVSARQGKAFLVQQSALQLYGSIQYAILQSGIQPHVLFGGVNMFERLSQFHAAGQLADCFKQEIVGPYMRELETRYDMQLKQMVERTVQLIHAHYMDDLSLDWCAERCETTNYTLSRAFKQLVGTNFVDYLTEYRVEKAKELLRTTQWRIQEIAERVGYQHSYFNRIFKRYEGMTPSQYRDKWEKD